MVLKQGEGYKPRGKTSAIVGTSKVQLQLPPEAGPGQAWAGKQKQGPMSRGQWSMEPSQGAASSLTSGYERTGGGLQKQLWKTPTSPLPVEASPFRWLCTSLLSQQQPTCACESCFKPETRGKATQALPCLEPVARLGLIQERWMHELPDIRQVWADGDVLCSIPVQKKHFYYQAWSVWCLNICCSLLRAADRGIIGGPWFTTFIFIYIYVLRKLAICQIWKCLIRSDGQIN